MIEQERTLSVLQATTIGLYIVRGLISDEWAVPIGPLDKAIEVGLIGLLWQVWPAPMATVSGA